MNYNGERNCVSRSDIYYNDRCAACDRSPELAIAHVPLQRWKGIYSPERALCAGTMFAELDLPFRGGKCNDR